MNVERFIYSDNPNFPFKYNGILIKTKDIMAFIDLILYEVWRDEETLNNWKLSHRYIGVYMNGMLEEVIYIDYDNILNTIDDLKKYIF